MTRDELRVYRSVALGLAWRTVHNAVTQPNIVIPTLVLVLFSFAVLAFTSALSRRRSAVHE